MPNQRTRKPTPRLKSFDYDAPGFYHVVICVKEGHHILGNIVVNNDTDNNRRGRLVIGPQSPAFAKTKLYEAGNIIDANIKYINGNLTDRKIDTHIIMPNHIHLIIEICKRADYQSAPTVPLSTIVRTFKSAVTKQVGFKFWQRGYYDRIIRDDSELYTTRQYILDNPKNWIYDYQFWYRV